MSTDFGQVKTQLDATCNTLEHMIDFPEASKEFQTLQRTVHHVEQQGFIVTRTPGRTQPWVEANRRIWVRAIVDNLRARLPNPELLVALQELFDPTQYPLGMPIQLFFDYAIG